MNFYKNGQKDSLKTIRLQSADLPDPNTPSYAAQDIVQYFGKGSYSVSVQSEGICDSQQGDWSLWSDQSKGFSYQGALSAPTNPVWDADQPGMASWDVGENAVHYSIQIYKDGVVFGEPVKSDSNQYDFNRTIQHIGQYTFWVRALGDNQAYSDSDWSQLSASYAFIEKLSTPTGLC